MKERFKPLQSIINRHGSVVIDGALSTQLELLGCDLADPLWTARVLLQDPMKIQVAHEKYFEAGAQVATTATYQASLLGFKRQGYNEEVAQHLIVKAVELAKAARHQTLLRHPERNRWDMLICGSIGPYGAYLANGAEYTGRYQLSQDEYRDFHYRRMQLLVDSGVDMLAIETMPRVDEIQALLEMLTEFKTTAWVTVVLDDASHLCDGTSLERLAALVNDYDQVEAVGVNCVKREWVEPSLRHLRESTTKPLIAYPNGGGAYDPLKKEWHSCLGVPKSWHELVPIWSGLGARCIGGCCRTLPEDIAQIAKLMQG